ncbi:hypothetical protein [Vallicoccus soli]|uniref:Uncharacterized protein n=1 Tax=Vallicoccus soli TaxID=2339232 RepID=A0A3A3YZY9_9ACTN|nr:hypothetical protein [Vallicoccus soli]RJK96391.1 hypothetical protein D5H78_09165 [Vallicoccus soli]
MADPTPPTDAELDTLIRARLALVGVDLDQLPAGAGDPVTGSPSRESALAYLRSVLRGTSTVISDWDLPAASPALDQQVAPPALYPSIYQAWTKGGLA